MPVESATYLNELDSSNPPSTDPTGQGDDHIRLVKAALLATFPNFSGAANISSGELNTLRTQILSGATSLVPTGAMMPFANTTSDPYWLRCNGATFAYATYPALGAFLGYSSGTCTLPNLEDTGRFVRSIQSGTSVRDTQSSQNKAHTHTGSVNTTGSGTCSGTTTGQSNDHDHGFGGTTDGQSNSHHHFVAYSGDRQSPSLGSSDPLASDNTENSFNAYHLKQATGQTANVGVSSDASDDHTHTFSATSGGTSANHTHDFTGSVSVTGSGSFTTASSGSSEARPEAYVAVWYIHI